MTAHPIYSVYKAPFGVSLHILAILDILELCSTGKAEMKEKPSSLNKKNVASRAN